MGGGTQKIRATFQPGHTIHGKYVVCEQIALGGSCSVFRGVDIRSNRSIALKVISKLNEDIEWQYQREIQALKSLRAPGIIELLDIIDDPDYIYICLEYCSGGTVHNYITARGERLPEPEVRHYFKQIIHAVNFAHQNGWVHRDIKLDNILLANDDPRDGRVVLCDWGFATTWDASKPQTRNCGTTHSLPPEMCKGDAYVGPECDVWSLGVVLYMMAVARIPFLGDNRRSTYQCIINGVYKQPSFLSDSLCHLISTMLETTVSSRATLNEVARHPWVMDTPFLGKRPTDLMWFEDTNTCSSEYETSLRTSDFEKFGLDHHGHGSQTCTTLVSFSDRHSHLLLNSQRSSKGGGGDGLNGGGEGLFLRQSSVGTNRIFESEGEEEHEGVFGEGDNDDEGEERGRQLRLRVGKEKKSEPPEGEDYVQRGGEERRRREEGEEEGDQEIIRRPSTSSTNSHNNNTTASFKKEKKNSNPKSKEGKGRGKRKGKEGVPSSSSKPKASSHKDVRPASGYGTESLEDTSEEEEDRKGGTPKKRDSKGKSREEKSKKPKRRKIRTESVESRVESLRRSEPKALKLQRGAINNKEEITERSSSGPTPHFPNLYKNSSEETGANFFSNLLSQEEKTSSNRISLSVGLGAFSPAPELSADLPEGSGDSLTALEFIRTSSPRKKRGFFTPMSDPLDGRDEKDERPGSQLGYSKEHKKSKPTKRVHKKSRGVHDSADDAMFRGADDSLFTSKSPKFLGRSSKTPTMSPGKSPKLPKTPKSPKSSKTSKSPILPFKASEGKRKRRTMSRNKSSGNRGQSEDDALFKDMEAGASEPQSFLLYSRKKSFSKTPNTPDQKKKDKGERRESQQSLGERSATVQELPPPSREPPQEFYYGSQGQNVGSRPRRNSFTRPIRRERKQSKDEGVQLEGNDPLIYALFRRFNFRRK